VNRDFVIKAVVNTVDKHGAPVILNSDQGSQFTSPDYVNTLKQYGIKISMDGKGRALDNAITERFWRTIKWEDIYIMQYEIPQALRQGIDAYIRYYNSERGHQSLNKQNLMMSTMPILTGNRNGLLKGVAVDMPQAGMELVDNPQRQGYPQAPHLLGQRCALPTYPQPPLLQKIFILKGF
jgi:hypothetical protein